MSTKEELEILRRLVELEEKATGKDRALPPAGAANSPVPGEKRGNSETALSYPSDVARGALKSLEGLEALSPAGQLRTLTKAGGFELPLPMFLQGVPETLLPTPQGDSRGRQVARAALEGVGGALAGPSGVQFSGPRMLASATGSGAAGGAVADLVDSAGKGLPEPIRKIASALSGALAGGSVAALASPSLSTAQERVRRTLQDADFPEAEANANLLRRSGAQTATVPDLFPGNAPIKSLASETRAAAGGEQLANKLANREQDLLNLSEAVKRRMGGKVSVADVANDTSEAANNLLEGYRRMRSYGTGAHMEGSKVPARNVASIYRHLRDSAKAAPSAAEAEAYLAVAGSLVEKGGTRFITDLQELSNQLKRLKENPVLDNASTARKFSAQDLALPIQVAEQALGDFSPAFKNAMGFYRDYTRNVMESAKEGVVGKLADRNPNVASPTPGARLEQVLRDQDPNAIPGIMKQLQAGGANPSDIAKALVQRRLESGSLDPETALYGKAGSEEAQRIAALLQSGGRAPGPVLEPAKAASLLQDFKGLPGSTNDLPISKLSFFAQPFASLKYVFNQAARTKDYAEMARLLSDPANLKELQKIAMYDPEIRRALTFYSLTQPALQQQGEK